MAPTTSGPMYRKSKAHQFRIAVTTARWAVA
jgi:hypothetical protein